MALQHTAEGKEKNRKVAGKKNFEGKKSFKKPFAKKDNEGAMDTNEDEGDSKFENEWKSNFERKRKGMPDATPESAPPKKKPYSGIVDANGKPDWKKMRIERKTLKESRKKKEMKPEIYELTKEAKAIWEEMRKESCPKNVRDKLCEQLHTLVKDHIKRFAFAHDTTRVLESLLVHGSEKIRENIHAAFTAKDDVLYLMKSKYGHFLALKLMKYSTLPQKDKLFAAMESKIVQLLRHHYASLVVNEFYLHYAKASHKAVIIKECYGPLMRLEKANDDLKKVLVKFPERKSMIMTSIQEIITFMLEKSLKDNVILHYLMHEYLENCEPPERLEIIEAMREHLVNILHTSEGSLLAMSCFWHGTPKDRKVIVKTFKGFIPKIACDKNGYKVLLSLFDTVDDTVLVSKAICGEILSNLNQLAMDQFGQRTIVYLLGHRTPLFFDPEIVKLLALGDKNEHTKKPIDSRIKDVSEGLYEGLVEGIENNFGMWVQNNSACLLTKFILSRFADKPLYSALKKIASVVSETEQNIDKKAVEMLVKFILTSLNEETRKSFSGMLLKGVIKSGKVDEWLKINRGCFALLRIWENSEPDTGKKVKELLKEHGKIVLENPTAGGKLLKKIIEDGGKTKK